MLQSCENEAAAKINMQQQIHTLACFSSSSTRSTIFFRKWLILLVLKSASSVTQIKEALLCNKLILVRINTTLVSWNHAHSSHDLLHDVNRTCSNRINMKNISHIPCFAMSDIFSNFSQHICWWFSAYNTNKTTTSCGSPYSLSANLAFMLTCRFKIFPQFFRWLEGKINLLQQLLCFWILLCQVVCWQSHN